MKYALKKGDNLLICVVANGRRGVWRMNNFEYECSDHVVELRIGTDSLHCAKY